MEHTTYVCDAWDGYVQGSLHMSVTLTGGGLTNALLESFAEESQSDRNQEPWTKSTCGFTGTGVGAETQANSASPQLGYNSATASRSSSNMR